MTRRTKRTWIVTLAISVAVLVVLFVVTPLLAMRGIVQAAGRGDVQGLERRVDFPALRASLKDELDAHMRDQVRDALDGQDRRLAALGMLLAPSLIDGAVDVLVTPQAVAAMVETARAPDPDPRAARPDRPDRDIRRSYGYRDPDTFVVTLTDPDRPQAPLHLLLERRALIDWKLAGVELPPADAA